MRAPQADAVKALLELQQALLADELRAGADATEGGAAFTATRKQLADDTAALVGKLQRGANPSCTRSAQEFPSATGAQCTAL